MQTESAEKSTSAGFWEALLCVYVGGNSLESTNR